MTSAVRMLLVMTSAPTPAINRVGSRGTSPRWWRGGGTGFRCHCQFGPPLHPVLDSFLSSDRESRDPRQGRGFQSQSDV